MMMIERLGYLGKIAELEEEESKNRRRLSAMESQSAKAREIGESAPEFVYSAIGHFHSRVSILRAELSKSRERLAAFDREHREEIAQC